MRVLDGGASCKPVFCRLGLRVLGAKWRSDSLGERPFCGVEGRDRETGCASNIWHGVLRPSISNAGGCWNVWAGDDEGILVDHGVCWVKLGIGSRNFEVRRRFAIACFEGASGVCEVQTHFWAFGNEFGEHRGAGLDIFAVVERL